MLQYNANHIEYFTFSDTFSGLRHAVSTRKGGCSDGPCISLNVGQHRYDSLSNITENRARICHAAGFHRENFLCMQQAHSDHVAVIRADSQEDNTKGTISQEGLPDTDAVITDVKNLTLMGKGADCPLVLLFDSSVPAIGVVHAGRKGTRENIAGKAVRKMANIFRSTPHSISAGISPCICAEHYPVSEEIVADFGTAFSRMPHSAVQNSADETDHLDLAAIIDYQLRQEGIPHVEHAEMCTYKEDDRFFSYRRDGEETGRFGLFASLPNA